MNDKSRNIRTSCGPSTLVDLSNNKFYKDYYELAKPYLKDDFEKKLPSVDELKSLAGKEFTNYYGTFPTCAVFAPGCLTIAGKSTNLVQSKSLSMAVQLFTLVIGKRSRGCEWCYVKTLSDEIDGRKVFDIYLNTEALDVSMERTSWIRYVKGTIQCFKASRVHVPGFKIVIASNVPMKCGLGSSSALVVALYTFLEAITNTYMGNVLEKALACHLAEKLAAYPCEVRIGDILTSVIGCEDKILAIDSRTLDIKRYDWNSMDVEFVFIEHKEKKNNSLKDDDCSCTDMKERKEILTLMSTASRWRTHPFGDSTIELLFSRDTINMNADILAEDKRVEKMINVIRTEQWEQLGKLLGENYRAAWKYSNSLSDDTERIVSELKTVEGVLGFDIIGRDCGASVVTLVQKSKLKNLISALNRTKIPQQRYCLMKPFKGASTIYSYECRSLLANSTGHKTYRPKLNKYYLKGEDNAKLKYFSRFEEIKPMSLYF